MKNLKKYNTKEVVVYGMWHLGLVTSACLASFGIKILASDSDSETLKKLQSGELPIYEPGLDTLINSVSEKNLMLFSDKVWNNENINLIWICIDTPVDEDDNADSFFVVNTITELIKRFNRDLLIIISSQVPLGTTDYLKNSAIEKFPNLNIEFALIPENLRLGNAINVFKNPDRLIIGLDNHELRPILESLLKPISRKIIWMSVKSAEMTKHAINSFLATSIVFANELAYISKRHGADLEEVTLGLKSDERIGIKSYLAPGNAFAGGTLARDVNFLTTLSEDISFSFKLLNSLIPSNAEHKNWARSKILDLFDDLHLKVAVWGMAYKEGTNTLRRSYAIELVRWLIANNATVYVHDELVHAYPKDLAGSINILSEPLDLDKDLDLLVICSPSNLYRKLSIKDIRTKAKECKIIDQNGCLISDPNNHAEKYYRL